MNMKTTRFILAFAAALSLGLAVFANVRTHGNVTASTQSMINSDASLSDADSAATGVKVADWNCLTSLGQAAATGVKVADWNCLTSQGQAAATGVKVADWNCLTA